MKGVNEVNKMEGSTKEFLKKIEKIIENKVNIIIVKFRKDRSGMSEINQLLF